MVFEDVLIELYKMLNNKFSIDLVGLIRHRVIMEVFQQQPFHILILIKLVQIIAIQVQFQVLVLVILLTNQLLHQVIINHFQILIEMSHHVMMQVIIVHSEKAQHHVIIPFRILYIVTL
jgi:hypothetical protein